MNPEPVIINPLAIYEKEHLQDMLDVSSDTIAKAMRNKELRSVKKGRGVFFLGEWVLDWIKHESYLEGGGV